MLSGRGMLPTCVVRMRSALAFIWRARPLAPALVHHEHDLAGLRVAQHVAVRVEEALERKRAIEHGLERALADGLEQVRGEPLAARERLFGRAGAERDADDRRALAGDLVEVAVTDPAGVAADAHQPRLERQHPDVV